MKQINYTGSSKIISRIVYLLNRKAPLPLDGDGDPSWGSNGQVLTTDGSGSTSWTTPQGGGSSYSAGDGINISAQNAISVDTAFTEASTRANIASGDSFSTILGKIKKFFSDLKTVAFTGAYADLTGQPTIPTDFVSKANGGTFGGNISVDGQNGTTSAFGISYLTLGNNIPYGTDKNSFGALRFYGGSSFYTDLSGVNATGNRTILLPDKDGTFALMADIPTDFVSKANGGTFNGSIVVDKQDGTTSSVGITELVIGNNKGQGVDKNSRGFLYLFSNTGKYVRVRNDNGTANRNIYFPDKDGTVALTSDLPTYQTITFTALGATVQNGSSAVFGTFTLPAGKWLLNIRGYSPLTPTYTEVQSQATLLLVRKSGQSAWDIIASLSYWMNYWQLFDVSSDTAYRLGLQNYEGYAVTISSSYSMTITAVKIG